MTETPLTFSVLVVTRNRAPILRGTLDRILEDDYPHKEVVVVDGASTDGTQAVLESYGNRIRWISEPDTGEYDAWNKALKLAKGDVLKWIPDDDLLRPGCVSAAARYLQGHPDVDILFGQATLCRRQPDGSLETLSQTQMLDQSRLGLHHWLTGAVGLNPVAGFVRSRAMARTGPFSLDYMCGDTEFWARAAKMGVRFAVMPDVVVDYIYTGDNMHLKRAQRFAFDGLRVVARYGTVADVARTAWHKRYILTGIAPFLDRHDLHPLRTLRKLRKRVLGE